MKPDTTSATATNPASKSDKKNSHSTKQEQKPCVLDAYCTKQQSTHLKDNFASIFGASA